jgi:Ca-activated chloride channel homolog
MPMLLRSFRYCLTIVALALLIIANRSGALTGQIQTDNQTFRARVDLVNVLCSVFDKNKNSFVTNLTQDDFSLYENNQKQEIKNFNRETNLPLTIALLVDTSGSVAPKLKFEKETATNFVQSIMRDKDRALLLQFDSGLNLLQDFTDDPNKIVKQIDKLQAAGDTALYDAIYRTCDEKLIRETGRKAMIILSDGDDSASEATLQQATEMALRAETIVFAISVTQGGFFGVNTGERKEGDSVLKEIANETGGRIFFPFQVEDLDEAFRQINQELRSQYNIGYLSSNSARDGSYRKLEIRIPERGLRLKYRKGYYAPAG